MKRRNTANLNSKRKRYQTEDEDEKDDDYENSGSLSLTTDDGNQQDEEQQESDEWREGWRCRKLRLVEAFSKLSLASMEDNRNNSSDKAKQSNVEKVIEELAEHFGRTAISSSTSSSSSYLRKSKKQKGEFQQQERRGDKKTIKQNEKIYNIINQEKEFQRLSCEQHFSIIDFILNSTTLAPHNHPCHGTVALYKGPPHHVLISNLSSYINRILKKSTNIGSDSHYQIEQEQQEEEDENQVQRESA